MKTPKEEHQKVFLIGIWGKIAAITALDLLNLLLGLQTKISFRKGVIADLFAEMSSLRTVVFRFPVISGRSPNIHT
jgi:hypothetical protein